MAEEGGRGGSGVAEQPDEGRRNLALAVFGAFGGMGLLGACAPEGRPKEVERITQAVVATTIGWADTVFGQYGADNRAAGDLNSAPGSSTQVLIVAGAVLRGDGGGGIFYWDSTTGTDDGGTVIVPGWTTGSTVGRQGACWRRIYDGPLNVKWFGARGHGLGNDAPFIMRAIDAARALRGGDVYIPSGEYSIEETIIIRKHCSYPVPIRIRGAGAAPNVSSDSSELCKPGIVRNGATIVLKQASASLLTPSQPLIEWESAAGDTEFFELDGLSVIREGAPGTGNGGVLLKYAGASDSRLQYATIRNCAFRAPLPAAGSSYALIDLEFIRKCIFENVTADGGDVGLQITRGGYIAIRNFSTPKKDTYGSNTGIKLDRCGSVTIQNPRFEGARVSAIKVTGSASSPSGNITIDGFDCEGEPTTPYDIDLDYAAMVIIQNSDFGRPLRISGSCRFVMLRNIALKQYGKIKIESGAAHVRGEHIALPNAGWPYDMVDLHANTTDVKLTLLEVNDGVYANSFFGTPKPHFFENGISSPMVLFGTMLLITGVAASGNNVFSGQVTNLTFIEKPAYPNTPPVDQKFDCKELTLIFTDTSSIVPNGVTGDPSRAAIRLDSAANPSSIPAGSILRLMYRDNAWWQVSFSRNV